MPEEIDLRRELAELSLEDLANCRRRLREVAARQEAATADARAALAAAGLPFLVELEESTEDAALAKEAAELALVEFEDARRAVLSSGAECARAKMPDGVSVKWLESPRVVDRDAVPDSFWDIDMKALKAGWKATDVPGVETQRKPSIVVAEVAS